MHKSVMYAVSKRTGQRNNPVVSEQREKQCRSGTNGVKRDLVQYDISIRLSDLADLGWDRKSVEPLRWGTVSWLRGNWRGGGGTILRSSPPGVSLESL